jgi:hypothetical protein
VYSPWPRAGGASEIESPAAKQATQHNRVIIYTEANEHAK